MFSGCCWFFSEIRRLPAKNEDGESEEVLEVEGQRRRHEKSHSKLTKEICKSWTTLRTHFELMSVNL